MFLSAQSVTDVIAHFIGYFELQVEEGRLRWDLQPFQLPPALTPEQPDLPEITPKFAAPLELSEYVPVVPYTPPMPPIVDAEMPHIAPAKVLLPKAHGDDSDAGQPHLPPFHAQIGDTEPPPFTAEPPGAVVFHVNQIALLMDNDVVSVGDTTGAPVLTPFEGQAFDAFVDAALDQAPALEATAPEHIEAIPAFMTDTVTALEDSVADTTTTPAVAAIAEDGATLHGDITATAAPDLAGNWINGAAAESVPEPLPLTQTEAPVDTVPSPEPVALDIAPPTGGSLALEAGGNIVANAATFVDAPITPATLAVMGDYHQVDAIVQTNAWSDTDTIAPSVQPLVDATEAAPTAAYNIASFNQQTLDTGATAAAENPGAMPQNWAVSTVAGDLTFAAWTTQYNFVLDNDIATLNATGLHATVTTGDNYVLNGVAFADIGRYFDMVIVAGNYYDGNFISQTNVLFDNDTILANGVCGTGSVSTGGNLLWNQASITHVGPAAIETGIPSAYADAASAITGDKYMPDSLRNDTSFEGTSLLRVLYVEGNLYDLCYVQQVNVLGDADRVALVRQQVSDALPDAHWNINTGGNLLANTASIVDYDTIGQHAFVGGSTYAHDILIQAEFVAGDDMPGLSPGHPASAPLANEAIAFLDSGADLTPSANDNLSFHIPHGDAPSLDVLHSVLA
jgi:hypothetical protein